MPLLVPPQGTKAEGISLVFGCGLLNASSPMFTVAEGHGPRVTLTNSAVRFFPHAREAFDDINWRAQVLFEQGWTASETDLEARASNDAAPFWMSIRKLQAAARA